MQAGVPQAELDARSTGKHTPVPGAEGRVHEPPASPAPDPLRATDEGADEEVAAWLDDDAIEMIDEGVGADSVVPLSERPPAMTGLEPPKRIPTLRKFRV